ncbi:MAG: hypothetical protein A3D92_05295 [Bacteroidetes bacterium RIFCSPHIGHO2_02_FULL_44_7]|nr:MAG: hypothetical protein A3D92_05295 [Bacteroidetes bacterium RIFCSPHIGHO2_02_FULL_44_7]
MKLFYCIVALSLSSFASAQSTGELVIFSNNGEPIYLIMNGVYQNYEPATNVRVQALTDEFYNTRVLCPNNTFEIQKNLMIKRGYTSTYRVIEKDGEYKLRFFSESPLETYQNDQAYGNQSTIIFHATGDVPTATTHTTTTTSTTSGGLNNNGEAVNINIQVGETGMNTGIYVNDGMDMNGGTSTTYSETITTTTTTSGSGGMYYEEQPYHDNHVNYESCRLDAAGFERLKSSIENESFSEDQLRIANQAAKNKCLSVSQIKEIAGLFSFSSEQLSFTKAAYERCQNRSDYYEVLEVFTFSADKKSLEDYINTH